ncbi:MAG: hypothetical protein FGM40_08210 [Rhodocyclaceae bacterium]|nr:hypothetical protein [Rhodocyclaceae bacterium]
MSKILSKTDILNSHDMRIQTVAVPEWGGSVRLRTLTGAERDAFEATLVRVVDGKRVPEMDNLRAKLLAATIVDEQDRQVFSASDVAALGRKSALALDRVFSVAQALNGMGVEGMEEALKNSVPGPSDASTSG